MGLERDAFKAFKAQKREDWLARLEDRLHRNGPTAVPLPVKKPHLDSPDVLSEAEEPVPWPSFRAYGLELVAFQGHFNAFQAA